jgi:hypothetical protein
LQGYQTYLKELYLERKQFLKKIYLVAWNTLCLPKSDGGIGIKDPELMIKIMGAKTWWRWLQPKKRTMEFPLETKISRSFRWPRTYQNDRCAHKFTHLELSMEKPVANPTTRLLGDSKWEIISLLEDS